MALVTAGCAGHVVPPPAPPVADGALAVSLFLVGDAGKPLPSGDPVLVELARQAIAAPRGSGLVFLGDNIYPRGLPDAGTPLRAEMERRLDAQLEVARKSGLPAWFIPGNHDWDRMGPDGWDAVRRAGRFIAERGAGLAQQVPAEGCPGPELADVGERLRLVFLDTQWWLQKPAFPKPRDPGSSCATDSEAEVEAALARAVADRGARELVVVGHHPLATAGEHGGHFPITTHLFPLRALRKWLWIPLPVLGSIYPIARANGITSQDLSGSANERMRAAFGRAMSLDPPLLFAAGHEHALQLFRGPVARYSAVSGAGIVDHEGPVGWNDSTLYASSRPGFMRLDVTTDGRFRLAIVELLSGGPREVASFWLTHP